MSGSNLGPAGFWLGEQNILRKTAAADSVEKHNACAVGCKFISYRIFFVESALNADVINFITDLFSILENIYRYIYI